MTAPEQPIALIGGTGRSGPGLALRLAGAGVDVIIGSRDAARAEESAATVRGQVANGGSVTGLSNVDAAQKCAIAIITVPYDGVAGLLPALRDALRGKVVISTVVPVAFVKGSGPTHIDVPEGSAAQQIASLLPESRVTAALHSVSSSDLADTAHSLDADSVVTGDDDDAVAQTIAVVESLPGLRGVAGGALRYSHYTEQLTVLILSINRRHKVNAGIRIAHLPSGTPATASH